MLFRSGLEVIEARWLFNIDFNRIQVVIQPQSIIHSMVEFRDGAVLAQLGTPDMRLPIEYALCYPERRQCMGERMDFTSLSAITFEQPDTETFRGLALAFKAGKIGGSMPTVLNAANERAVSLFLREKISYLAMADLIEDAMEMHKVMPEPSLEDILACEQEVYRYIDGRYQ